MTRKAKYTVILLVIFAIAFSLAFMMRQSVGLDESQSIWQAEHSLSGVFHVVAEDVHVPLYLVTLHYWLMIFGTSALSARVLSLIFYAASIPLVYFLGKLSFNNKIGIIATVIFALSPFTNWYGSMARMYSMLAFFTVLNQIFFLLIMKNKRPEHAAAYWFGFFASALFGMYTHYFFFFVLAADGIFYLGNRKLFPKRSFRNFLATGAILAALFLPWLKYVNSQGGFGRYTSPVLPPPTSVDVFNTFSNFLFGFQTVSIDTVILSSWPLLLLFLFLALQKNKRVSPDLIYHIIFVGAPVIIAAGLSHIMEPFYLSRYFIGLFPSLAIMLGWLFSVYPKQVAKFAIAGLMIAMIATLSIQTVSAATPVKEDYRGVADYLSANATGRDVIAVSAPFTIYPMEYYYEGPADLITLPIWNQLIVGPIPNYSTDLIEKDSATLAGYSRLYLVLSYDQGYETDMREYFDEHYARIDVKHFSPGLDVYVYQLNYNNATLSDALRIAQASGAVAHFQTSTISTAAAVVKNGQ